MFFTIFLAIVFGGTLYVLWRLFSFWGLRHGVGFWLLAVVLAFGYIGANILDHRFPSMLSRGLLHVTALWLGVGLLAVCLLAVHDLLRLFIRFPVSTSRWVVVGLLAALTLYSIANAFIVRVRTVTLPAPVDMDIAQLSDIHLGSISSRHLARIVRRTNALNPDLVLITGDLLDSYSGVTDKTLAPICDLAAPAYFAIGNHERYAGLDRAMDLIAATPVRPLRNEQAVFGGVQIIGIDDSGREDQVARVLKMISLAEDKYKILMYHRPQGLDAAADAGIDLMLSGHTHNGQIFPFNFVVRSQFQHLRGIHQKGNTTLNINTGTGFWGPPMRLGSRSEITLIKLRKQ